jgi:hypothetical protein
MGRFLAIVLEENGVCDPSLSVGNTVASPPDCALELVLDEEGIITCRAEILARNQNHASVHRIVPN